MTDQNNERKNPHMDPLLAPQALAYPYMFAGRSLELVMLDGWHAPFAKLCDDIDAALGENKHGFYWVQLKEKFGQPRWYWEMDGESDLFMDMQVAPTPPTQDQLVGTSSHITYRRETPGELRGRIRQLVDAATAECDGRCMVCGEPGHRKSMHGWLQTLCDQHAREREGDGTDD